MVKYEIGAFAMKLFKFFFIVFCFTGIFLSLFYLILSKRQDKLNQGLTTEEHVTPEVAAVMPLETYCPIIDRMPFGKTPPVLVPPPDKPPVTSSETKKTVLLPITEITLGMTVEEARNMPRTLRFLSEEENIATTLNYVAPPETIIIPKASWEPIYFKGINKFSEAAKWPSLREVGVPAGSLEIRIWIEQMYNGDQVLRLCYHEDKWTGFFSNIGYQHIKHNPNFEKIKDIYDEGLLTSFLPVLALTPQTNWENLWKKVESLGILTLPDSSTLPNERIVPGSRGYIVEINDGVQYRTYHYSDPERQEWPEAGQFIQILKTLHYEFIPSLPKNEISWIYLGNER